MIANITDFQTQSAQRINAIYESYLRDIPSLDLKQAINYVLSNQGKLIRPQLVYASGNIFNAPLENLDVAASAIEMMHTYSLIHDDLPCMDNADLRRNQITCHKQFGDGMGVLTGDALQTLSIQILATHIAPLSSKQRLAMIKTLTQACGPFGMAAGQALDINMNLDKNLSENLILELYKLKTGALITACLELGRLSSTNEDEFDKKTLLDFGEAIGLAFQIQDDLLDMQGAAIQLGKKQGMDVKNNKMTYPVLFGVDKAQDKIDMLYLTALDAINHFGNKANLLREFTQYLLKRSR